MQFIPISLWNVSKNGGDLLYSKTEEIIAKANNIFSNSIGDELILIFGNKYFGKTKLIELIQNSLCSQNEYYVINPQIHYTTQLQYVTSTIMKCYIIAILQTLDVLCKHKSFNSIRMIIDIFKLNKKTVNLLFSCSLGRHDKLITKMLYYNSEDLRNILNILSSSKPYAFLINHCELVKEDVDHLCKMHTKYTQNSACMAKIDYAIGIRPYKDNYKSIEKLQTHFSSSIHYFSLLPDLIEVENENTPYEVNNLKLTNCEFSAEIALAHDYIHSVSSLPEYTPVIYAHDDICNQSLAFYAQLSAHEMSSLKQISAITKLYNNFFRDCTVSKKEFLSNPIIWFLDGKYTIIDAWSYYVFFRKNKNLLILESQNLFFHYTTKFCLRN